jgi:hypothetical protein
MHQVPAALVVCTPHKTPSTHSPEQLAFVRPSSLPYRPAGQLAAMPSPVQNLPSGHNARPVRTSPTPTV